VINSPDPTVSATTALTEVTVIVHKDDFMKELGWCAVQDAVHSTEQGRQGFVVETDNNTSDWQVHRVRLVLTCSIPGVWHVPVVAQAVTDKHVEGMFLIA